jgi:hypothetical protein
MNIAKTLRGLLVVGLLSATFQSANATLVAYWNFNSYNGIDTSINADSGSGTIAISGFPSTDLLAATGTTLNALSGNLAGAALGLEDQANNGDFLTISFSMLGLQDLVLSYATRKIDNSGFNANQWAYSTDGSNFNDFGSLINPGTDFGVQTLDFSSIAALDNDDSVFLRYTLSGATSGLGINAIDNLQLNAAPVPFPPAILLLGSVLAWVGLIRRREVA